MQRPGEQAPLVADLDDAAEVHHHHAIGHVLDHAEVVRDEDASHAELGLQVHEQVQDLGLDRDVERRDRLVGDHDARLQDHRAGNRDALALATRKHVRVAPTMLGSQANPGQPLGAALAALGRAQRGVDTQGLLQGRGDGLARIQRGIGVLEHHLHLAPQRSPLRATGHRNVDAVQPQRAGAGPLDHRQLARQRGLATA